MKLKIKNKELNFDISEYYPLVFTLIFVVVVFQYPLTSLESIIYDLKIKSDIAIKPSSEIVIITMDEESDDYLGDLYPYTYATHLRLISKLVESKPASVNYFITLPDSNEAEDLSFKKYIEVLQKYTKYGGKVNFTTFINEEMGEILPPDSLRNFGYNLAQINIDNAVFAKDDVVRRAIFNVSGEESSHLKIANQYRQFINKNELTISDVIGTYYNDEADANLVLFRYPSSPVYSEYKYKSIPFHRVLVGNFSPEIFKDKIVLIGSNYISQSDNFYLTPFNQEEYKSPGLMIHASIIDSFIQNKTIKMIPRVVSNTIALLLAIALSILISKLKPKDGLIITLLVLVSILFVSYLFFVLLGLWIYTAHLLVTIFIVYYVWIPFRAIDEYQIRYKIEEESKLLKQVEKLKQNFLSLMSHDLKTPVAKIAGVADNLYNFNRDNPDVRDKALSIVDSTKELNKFISSILDLTKIESSDIGLNKVSKDINLIVESVVEDLEYNANQKNIRFETDLAPLYPIEIDVTLITRVISNLVENAIKYSGNETVVEIRTWDDEDWVYVEIKDNGVGIPEEEIKNVFEKFYRIKNDANHSIKGSGLGLYLVRYFVELHGGTISASSIFGKETKFLVKLINK